MHLIVLTGIIVLMLGLITLNSQVSAAKHSSSSSEDKKSSDSNNDPKMGTSDKQTNPTNSQNGQSDSSDTIPITPAVLPQCDSSNTNPTCVAATNELIKEQTELEKQRMLIAQQQQEQNEISLENQRVIQNLQDQTNKDTGSSGSSSGSSSSSESDEQSSNENENSFSDKNLGAESHFVVMSHQDKGVGLYRIVSDEKELDTGILPKTIRLVQTFESAGEAMSWLQDYDDKN
jgi:hypothetical protein